MWEEIRGNGEQSKLTIEEREGNERMEGGSQIM
jgi:hypothetical protein